MRFGFWLDITLRALYQLNNTRKHYSMRYLGAVLECHHNSDQARQMFNDLVPSLLLEESLVESIVGDDQGYDTALFRITPKGLLFVETDSYHNPSNPILLNNYSYVKPFVTDFRYENITNDLNASSGRDERAIVSRRFGYYLDVILRGFYWARRRAGSNQTIEMSQELVGLSEDVEYVINDYVINLLSEKGHIESNEDEFGQTVYNITPKGALFHDRDSFLFPGHPILTNFYGGVQEYSNDFINYYYHNVGLSVSGAYMRYEIKDASPNIEPHTPESLRAKILELIDKNSKSVDSDIKGAHVFHSAWIELYDSPFSPIERDFLISSTDGAYESVVNGEDYFYMQSYLYAVRRTKLNNYAIALCSRGRNPTDLV